MIIYDYIIEAQEALVKEWGEDGKRVIEECAKITPFNGLATDFLKHCTTCGGNWGGTFLTGIQELYPNVYDVIPDDMGVFAWSCICYTLLLCGVDTSNDANK